MGVGRLTIFLKASKNYVKTLTANRNVVQVNKKRYGNVVLIRRLS